MERVSLVSFLDKARILGSFTKTTHLGFECTASVYVPLLLIQELFRKHK